MTDNTLSVGTLLRDGTYRVIKQLNSGGFGNTYVVENIHFCETYAMKEFFMQGVTTRRGNTVSVSQSDNADVFRSQKEKFKKEAQRIRKLSHPNIVKIYDLFEENDTYYYVMDYIDGESLAERLKRQGAMNESEAWEVLQRLLDALSVVHSSGFTHMDIKPGNIMRNRQGKIYLIDFGASKQMTSNEQRTLSTSTAMPYSKGYAPMEQVEQDMSRIGPWTDFYAVGATLYKLLTNQQPPTSSEIINDSNPFSFPNNVNDITRSIVKWLMNPARKERPQSVVEIRQRINANESNGLFTDRNNNKEKLSSNQIDDNSTTLDGLAYFDKNKDTIEIPCLNHIIIMKKVEGGTFVMGESSVLRRRALFSDESPTHHVTLSTFYIGETQVTQELWEIVMGNNPSFHKGTDLPVDSVTWNQCQTFISKLNKLTGVNFRLPTEAEWEFAARGGNLSNGYKYSGSNKIAEVAWYGSNSGRETHPVKTKAPNELGIYDMSGNINEWCNDWYDYDYYKVSVKKDPLGPLTGTDRVLRGGYYLSDAVNCRVTERTYAKPNLKNNYNYANRNPYAQSDIDHIVAITTGLRLAISCPKVT